MVGTPRRLAREAASGPKQHINHRIIITTMPTHTTTTIITMACRKNKSLKPKHLSILSASRLMPVRRSRLQLLLIITTIIITMPFTRIRPTTIITM